MKRMEHLQIIRGPSPCKDCQERFIACSDRCPKDERGELGYRAWKAEIQRIKDERKKLNDMPLPRIN